MRNKIILAGISFFILVLGYLFYSYSFIEVALREPEGQTSFLVKQGEKIVLKSTTDAPSVRKLVKRGTYEVTAQQSESSYFAVADTGGFLSTTRLDADLKKQSSRSFLGSNPASCMDYDGSVFISYGCGGPFTSANIHVPASASAPSYTKRLSSSVTGFVEGIVHTERGSFALVRARPYSEDQGAPHALYEIINGNLTNGVGLRGLSSEASYAMTGYKDGLLVYAQGAGDAYYFQSANSEPEVITLPSPNDRELSPYMMSLSGDVLLVAYAKVGEEELDLDLPESAEVRTEVVLFNNTFEKKLQLGKRYSDIVFCGTEKICAQLGSRIDVYDTTKKARLLYSISDAKTIVQGGQNLLFTSSTGVVEFDVNEREGYLQYAFGGYKFCGINLAVRGYLICLIDSRGDKSALFVDPSQSVSDLFDQKILGLLALPSIKNVSVSGRYIYISPDLGSREFIEATGTYGYDPATTQTVTAAIDKQVSDVGLDLSQFTVINPLKGN